MNCTLNVGNCNDYVLFFSKNVSDYMTNTNQVIALIKYICALMRAESIITQR